MILFLYIVLLLTVFLLTKGQSEKVRTGLILSFNFVFVLAMQCVIRMRMIHDPLSNAIGSSLYNTVQTLTFNGDIDWSDRMAQSWQAQIWLIVFIAGVLTVESVLVAFFGRFFAQCKLKLKCLFAKEQYIIVGKADEASLLISNTLAHLHKPCIVYIPTEQTDENADFYKLCRVEKISLLSRLSSQKQYHIVLLPETEYTNLEILSALNESAKESDRILVIDEQLSAKKEDFLTEVPYFENSGEIEFLHTEIHSEEYFHAIKAHAGDWKQIFISTQDTKANINIAVKLCLYYYRIGIYHDLPQIVVVLNDAYSGAKHLLDKFPNITVIDVDREIINYETLIGRSQDLHAKDANQGYNAINGGGTSWNKLGTFTEASNRAVAFDAVIKRKLFKLSRASGKQTLDFLARYEHSRWNAFHHARGWRKMPVSDLTEDELAHYKTKHPAEKRHICLVSWDEIDSLPQKEPGLLKSYDMQNVIDALGDELKQ